MKKYLEEYQRLFVENKVDAEKELENSTELLDEADSAVYNESIGKWLKNIFKSKDGKLQELYKTWFAMCKAYGFHAARDEDGDLNPQCQIKREGNSGEYLVIFRLYEADSHKYLDAQLTVKDWETGKIIQGLNKVDIRIKHSWTKEEIADAVSTELRRIGEELTTNGHGKATSLDGRPGELADKEKKQQTANNSAKQEQSQSVPLTNDNIVANFGMPADTLLPRINQVAGSKPEKMNILRNLRSVWAKLSDEEKEMFRALQ
jgi:hypothetical protein